MPLKDIIHDMQGSDIVPSSVRAWFASVNQLFNDMTETWLPVYEIRTFP
jgi:hypothetical protein